MDLCTEWVVLPPTVQNPVLYDFLEVGKKTKQENYQKLSKMLKLKKKKKKPLFSNIQWDIWACHVSLLSLYFVLCIFLWKSLKKAKAWKQCHRLHVTWNSFSFSFWRIWNGLLLYSVQKPSQKQECLSLFFLRYQCK